MPKLAKYYTISLKIERLGRHYNEDLGENETFISKML
jgi:hypothetical protein